MHVCFIAHHLFSSCSILSIHSYMLHVPVSYRHIILLNMVKSLLRMSPSTGHISNCPAYHWLKLEGLKRKRTTKLGNKDKTILDPFFITVIYDTFFNVLSLF